VEPNPRDLFLYWIQERYDIFLKRKNNLPKPWSTDEIFQRTYFCNVHRENDRVTQFIRTFYNPFVQERFFEYNIVYSRFINWPPTIQRTGYLYEHNPGELRASLEGLARDGKIWGNAYVITTHGQKMPKIDYLTDQVLDAVYKLTDSLKAANTCEVMARQLQDVGGIGSFLAGQIVADLKNTPGHPLYMAPDKRTFVVPGPGSVRGASWWWAGKPGMITPLTFKLPFGSIRKDVDLALRGKDIPYIDNQDLQNCLCEFDKYMRVRTGTGRSKRSYNG
jgi:hypothetical protein